MKHGGVGWVVTLVACHSGGTQSPLAGDASSDAAADAADAAADAPALGPITIVVYGDGQGDQQQGYPWPGQSVYFTAPDHTLIAELVTDANGTATAIAPPGTDVMVARANYDTSIDLDVYEGLLPGDQIIDGPTNKLGSGQGGPNVWAQPPLWNDATLYTTIGSCGFFGANTPTEADLQPPDCALATAGTLVSWATDLEGNFGYTYVTDVDFTQHESEADPITFPDFIPGSAISATFTNLPSLAAEADDEVEFFAAYTLGTDPARLGYVDVRYGGPIGATEDMVTAGIAPVGDHTQMTATISNGASYSGAYFYSASADQQVTTWLVDGTKRPNTITSVPAFDLATNTISWTEDSSATPASTVLAGQSWTASYLAPPGGNPALMNMGMTVTAPHGSTLSLTYPPVPADLSMYAYSTSYGSIRASMGLLTNEGRSYHDSLVGNAGDAPQWQEVSPIAPP